MRSFEFIFENIDILQKQWLQKLANGPIDISPNGFSQEEKRILRPLYQRGLIVVDDKLGKKVLRLGRGNWYELATDTQKKILDNLEKSPGGFEDLTYQSSGDDIYTSASSSFEDYEVVPGIRIISFKSLGKLLDGYETPNEIRRIDTLAQQIEETKSIAPLFIGLHANGSLYIIEGQHRARALLKLGYDSVPGVVVVDLDSSETNISEEIDKNIDIEIINNVENSYRNGYAGTLIAKTPEQQVGYLSYSIYRDVPHINMISVVPAFRRFGIASKMLKELQKLSPNEEIDWGITTDLGSKLRGSIDYIRRPNPDIIQKKRKLAGIRSKLAKLNYKLDKLKDTNPVLARRFIDTVGNRWNKLNDLEYKLDNELYLSKGEYSKFIPEKFINEVFDAPREYEVYLYNPGYKKFINKDLKLELLLIRLLDRETKQYNAEIEFTVDNSTDITGKGNQFPIFSTVLKILDDNLANFVTEEMSKVMFSVKKSETSRLSLYRRFVVPRISKILGSDWEFNEINKSLFVDFVWSRKNV